jgi:UMF1 family MFS transporter
MATNRRSVFAWCFYDWANSAFALTVMAGFFPLFFKNYWSAGVEPTLSTARLGFGDASAGLIVALLSPFLGAIAYAGRVKKQLMFLFVLLGVISTSLFFVVGQGLWFTALVVFVVASIGFNCANLFYDSLLTDIADKHDMDWISSLGYALGYLGCGVLFVFNIFMISKPEFFGLSGKAAAVKMSLLSAAIWWGVFAIPLFVFVKEKYSCERKKIQVLMSESLTSISVTFRKVLKSKTLLLFLIAYWFYIDGLNTFILMAVDFGLSIGLSDKSLMMALLVVQLVAFPSALLFGKLAQKFGAFIMILSGLIIYILVTGIGSIILRTQSDFIILAGITGIAQGGIQALSRSYFAKLIPESESAEYFGFSNIVSRFAVIIGPPLVGMVAFFTHKAGIESKMASRLGMSSVGLLFLAGAIMLVFAELNRKKNAALSITEMAGVSIRE